MGKMGGILVAGHVKGLIGSESVGFAPIAMEIIERMGRMKSCEQEEREEAEAS